MNKILISLDSFTEWLIAHPSIVFNQRKTNDGKWYLTNACNFDENVKHHVAHKNDTYYGKDHSKCPIAFGYITESGGVSGGSCWDSSNPREYSETYVLPDMAPFLIEIITYFYDDMSLKEYCKHFHGVARTGSTEVREYYGNKTDYASIYMLVNRVYAGLIELDIERERKKVGL